MKCPHCLEHFRANFTRQAIVQHEKGALVTNSTVCPGCEKPTVFLIECNAQGHDLKQELFYPKGIARSPLSEEVPRTFADDYREACIVLPDSPKASAALSRRCLQHLLRDVANVKPNDLHTEIEQAVSSGKLPSHIAEALHAVRIIGNFAAHPTKSKATGEIVSVESGEAEWNLDVLEALFDFYFVQPALLKKKKDALNAKLAEAGKPQI